MDNHYVKEITKDKVSNSDEYEGCNKRNEFGCIIPKCFTNNFKLNSGNSFLICVKSCMAKIMVRVLIVISYSEYFQVRF